MTEAQQPQQAQETQEAMPEFLLEFFKNHLGKDKVYVNSSYMVTAIPGDPLDPVNLKGTVVCCDIYWRPESAQKHPPELTPQDQRKTYIASADNFYQNFQSLGFDTYISNKFVFVPIGFDGQCNVNFEGTNLNTLIYKGEYREGESIAAIGIHTEEDIKKFLSAYVLSEKSEMVKLLDVSGDVTYNKTNTNLFFVKHPGLDSAMVVSFQQGNPFIVGQNGFYPDQLLGACAANLQAKVKDLPDDKAQKAIELIRQAQVLLTANDQEQDQQ